MITDQARSSSKARRWAVLVLILTGWTVDHQAVAQQNSGAVMPVIYSHGDPTNDEQYLLQKLNRARLNPAAEGQRLAAWLRGTTDGQGVVAYYGTDLAPVLRTRRSAGLMMF